ncbi:PocR ligand-binding domain-containing protein [Photobacterium sp. DNB23_23_1]|uniref:PocR ligand-binding domain-containing protein n=1 Tax=Photobacterium pectinilyticum TaxID=2906793 RepID=A0ABT1N8T4_9GAMM|nr:PocR ligand-binding domain-containing protein [Photobacterium sp. ZSDE20]MCQ1059664.1 PocR ligand-binding domain-containing protein [Photobacterium sp. ZSDE20]MDD1825822.1 PocR ligand-binding domain-containing protein [Photobacterium sp. ZSDE20]
MISNDIVNEIAYDFAMATGLAVLVVDLDGNEISPRFNFTPLCERIRTHSSLFEICKRCDRVGGLTSLQEQKTMFYRCHVGLIDFSIPLMIKGNLLGFVQCGQAKIVDKSRIPIITHHKHNWHQNKELMRLYDEMPTVKMRKIVSASAILKTIIDNYLSEKLVLSSLSKSNEESLSNERNCIQSKYKIEKAIEFINKNITSELTLDSVAYHVDLSPFYFSRLFKKHINIGFNAYLNQQRINDAKLILTNNNASVSDVAKQVGYNNASYFIKQFKKQCDMTPLEFRHNNEISEIN